MQFGKPNDADLRDPAASDSIAVASVQNLQELLDAIEEAPPSKGSPKGMLRTAAKHVSEYLNNGPKQIAIDDLLAITVGFKLHLKERRYKPRTVDNYCRIVREIVERARQFGWVPQRPDVTQEWEKILQCVSGRNGAAAIVKYAIATGKKPEQFTDKDLEEWSRLTTALGRAHLHVKSVAARFRNRIFRAGLEARVPNLSPPSEKNKDYGQRLDEFPEPLRAEITSLIKWGMTAELLPGGKRRRRQRPVSAFNFQSFICRFYGFVSKVKREQVSDMKALFTESLMFSFANWCRSQRELRKRSVSSPLKTLNAAVKTYAHFKGTDFDWLKTLIGQLDDNEEDELLVREAKERRWVDYDDLEELPEMMRRNTEGRCKKGTAQFAAAMRDILLIKWLLILPWRQRNFREARIGRREDGANIFKAGVLDLPTIARPKWLVEELKRNPNLEVWQFRFRPHETKTGHLVHGILPIQIAGPLEEYLNIYRPLLISGGDPGTVFINDDGRPFDSGSIRNHVVNATFKYFGRPVNPHLFRDIFAVKFLEEQPENFLTLAKILWHRDVNTTIRLYGRNYDESYGARASEEWHDKRAQRRKQR
jgi:integrase